jgi:hypothetical protein
MMNSVRFEVFKIVKTSMLLFWIVTPCGLVDRYGTNVSEKYTVPIFRAENGDGMFLRNAGITTHEYRRRYDPGQH